MTDENSPPPATRIADPADFMQRYQAFEAKAAELHPSNKAALFTELRNAGIARVVVDFDGYGDSGQIEQVTAFGADDVEYELPDVAIAIRKMHFGQEEPETLSQSLGEAIETLAYAFLASTHGGWENNEGAFGEFTFDVAARSITLDYNERYETSKHYGHEF